MTAALHPPFTSPPTSWDMTLDVLEDLDDDRWNSVLDAAVERHPEILLGNPPQQAHSAVMAEFIADVVLLGNYSRTQQLDDRVHALRMVLAWATLAAAAEARRNGWKVADALWAARVARKREQRALAEDVLAS